MKTVLSRAGQAAGCMLLSLLGAPQAQAFEGGVSPFPVGSTGEYVAGLPPIPGLFAVSYTHLRAHET